MLRCAGSERVCGTCFAGASCWCFTPQPRNSEGLAGRRLETLPDEGWGLLHPRLAADPGLLLSRWWLGDGEGASMAKGLARVVVFLRG